MEIRGAGKIARSAANAMLLHSKDFPDLSLQDYCTEMTRAAKLLIDTRPTAVSLPNAVNQIIKPVRQSIRNKNPEDSLEVVKNDLESRAEEFIKRSEEAVGKIGEIGAGHIRDGDVIMTHCNSQAALSCILTAKEKGLDIEVYATEVRPRNQGHLTIKTLNDAGIKTNFIVDSAVRYFMKEVDLCITGADAITAGGAVINKVGTSQIALAAKEARVNLLVAAETYKFAPRSILGERIIIEERPAAEVLPEEMQKELPNVKVRNPTFDVTPAEYVDLIITEVGAVPPEMAYIIMKDYLAWDFDKLNSEYSYYDED